MKAIAILFITVIVVLFAAAGCINLYKKKKYEKTLYFVQTGNPFNKVMQDIGLIGEYFTYQCLAPLNGYKKFIFNCYLPKADGETTEVDVILLHESGIYVFESKNYSGWIFGNESQTFWTQTLPSGKGKSQKSRFFNPIMQNAGHIKQLKAFLASDNLPIYSYVLFSDRCELKNVKLEKTHAIVIHRADVLSRIQKNYAEKGNQLSVEQIDAIFEKLSPLAAVDESVKQQHIKNINEKYKQSAKAKPVEPAAVDDPNQVSNDVS